MTRLFGDLQLAEDSVQEACSVALGQWSVEGTPVPVVTGVEADLDVR